MQYNQPWDQPSNPNAPYVDGNPAAGIEGSIVPAFGIEYDQREIVEVIAKAYSRGYKDFTGTPCSAPTNADLQQLRKALEGFIESQITVPQWYIDTAVTFTIHGAGANFPDLVSALQYLSKYIITNRGFVTLAITAGRWNYGATQIKLNHPNGDRILITGANLTTLPSFSTFPITGYTPGQRVNDRTAALNNLRACYASEFTFSGGGGIINSATGFTITKMLISGARNSEPGIWNSSGMLFVTDCSVANCGYTGLTSVGGCLYLSGFCSASGCGTGVAATNGLLWHNGAVASTSNDNTGFSSGYSSIISGGAVGFCCGNGGQGGGVTFASLEWAEGTKFNYNGGCGVFADQAQFQVYGGGPGTQFWGNGQPGLYVTIGSTAQGPGAAFGGNGGNSITCGQFCTAYFVGSSGVVGNCYPAANTFTLAGMIIV